MGDLISRSRVIENIWDVFNSYANDSQRFDEYETKAINNAFKVLQKQIENQPTAYSVENVVTELKENSKVYCEEYHQREGSLYIQDVVEIVRNGGKE